MSELFNDAREALDRAVEKAAPVVDKLKDGVSETLSDAKEKAAPAMERAKERAGAAI